MIQRFLCTYKSRQPISNFYFWKKWFFQICSDCPSWKTNYLLGHNFWLIFSNVLKFSGHEIYSSSTPSIKIWAKNMKISSHRYLPKNLYYQNRQFGPLGVKNTCFQAQKSKLRHVGATPSIHGVNKQNNSIPRT